MDRSSSGADGEGTTGGRVVLEFMLPPVRGWSLMDRVFSANRSAAVRSANGLAPGFERANERRTRCYRPDLGSQARMMGLEPTTSGVTGRCSNQLSYIPNPAWWLRN